MADEPPHPPCIHMGSGDPNQAPMMFCKHFNHRVPVEASGWLSYGLWHVPEPRPQETFALMPTLGALSMWADFAMERNASGEGLSEG